MMESSGAGTSRQLVTRGMKRAAKEEEERAKRVAKEEKERLQREKRTKKGFRPRLIPSATSPGSTSILIGRNDILVDPKNPQKILINDDTEVKVEVKEEGGALLEVEMEEGALTSGFNDQVGGMPDEELGGSDRPEGFQTIGLLENEEEGETTAGSVDPSFSTQISLKVEFDHDVLFSENDQSGGVEDVEELNCGGDSNLDWSETERNFPLELTTQKECTRCLDLEKKLKATEKIMEDALKTKEETEKAREEADKIMEAMKIKDEEKDLRIRELELELELESLRKRYQQELLSRTDEAEDSISSRKSRDEEEIEALVLKAGNNWKEKSGRSFLHVAAESGNLKALQYFISIEGFKADINSKDKAGSTPIMEAVQVKRNFTEIAKVLVANGADLNAINNYGENALYIALTSGMPAKEIEKIFGSLTSSIFSLTDEYNDTVLHKEAQQGDLKALEYYMSLKPHPNDINARNWRGWTPIMEAVHARDNFSPIVDLLLKNGANFEHGSWLGGIIRQALQFKRPLTDIKKLVDVGAPWKKDSVLFSCISAGHVEALQYFITKGANVNAMTSYRETPLLIGLFERRSDIVDILIENGAKPFKTLHLTFVPLLNKNFKDNFLVGPSSWIFSLEILEKLSKLGMIWDNCMLHEFAEADNWEAVRYCILKGADVNSKDSFGKTPLLHVVTSTEANPEIVDFLIAKGAKVNVEDEEGFNILHLAVKTFSCPAEICLEVVKKLLSHGATWSTGVVGSGTRKESILHAAVLGEHANVVEYFISKGVDVNARDSNGDTPFILAVKERNWIPKMLNVLVNGGTDPDATDKDGNTALLIEVGKTKRRLAAGELLVELGCDWRVPNNEGVTVLSKLEKEGDSEFLEYFRSLG